MKRFFGQKGYYAALITTMIMLYGGVLIYYQLLTQTLFPFIVGIQDLMTGNDTPFIETSVDFSKFSLSWISVIIFFPLYYVICKRDRGFFIRLSTVGVLFIIFQILFVVAFFIYSLTNTSYSSSWISENKELSQESEIVMFGSDFKNLAGMLAAGYYMHQLGLPIILDSKNQKNNSRDVFLGYFFVFLTYCIIGLFGYIGFSGSHFEGMDIKQNILNMFSTKNPIATVVRIVSFIQIFSVYPLLFHVVRVQFFRTFFSEELHGIPFYLFNFVFSLP
jgi:hypothetical protein